MQASVCWGWCVLGKAPEPQPEQMPKAAGPLPQALDTQGGAAAADTQPLSPGTPLGTGLPGLNRKGAPKTPITPMLSIQVIVLETWPLLPARSQRDSPGRTLEVTGQNQSAGVGASRSIFHGGLGSVPLGLPGGARDTTVPSCQARPGPPALMLQETGSGRVPFKLPRHQMGLGEQGGSLLPLHSLEHPPKEGSLAFGKGLGTHRRFLTSHIPPHSRPPQPCNYPTCLSRILPRGVPLAEGAVRVGRWKSWLSQPVEQTMASPSRSLPLVTSPGQQQLKTRRPQRDTDIDCYVALGLDLGGRNPSGPSPLAGAGYPGSPLSGLPWGVLASSCQALIYAHLFGGFRSSWEGTSPTQLLPNGWSQRTPVSGSLEL